MVTFHVEDQSGNSRHLEAPVDMSLSLMEFLKASDYNILATCGGMALCATCHVTVLDGEQNLSPANDTEMDMIDTLPNAKASSRLACQIRISPQLQDVRFRLMEGE
ncbi:MAG TPA: 2Fe-2S iron-sulfur cluster-binding protein [Chryseosolibacter sp.]|nr:2Fe-2S iron-sulfur cluster-binding protein [Chryseosolibacter sp.]